LSRVFQQHQAIAEAELAAHGIHPVSIAHGDPETQEETTLLIERVPTLAHKTGHLTSRRGGNDNTTYLFGGNGAEEASLDFIEGPPRKSRP
jgi:hypothetical protein